MKEDKKECKPNDVEGYKDEQPKIKTWGFNYDDWLREIDDLYEDKSD